LIRDRFVIGQRSKSNKLECLYFADGPGSFSNPQRTPRVVTERLQQLAAMTGKDTFIGTSTAVESQWCGINTEGGVNTESALLADKQAVFRLVPLDPQ